MAAISRLCIPVQGFDEAVIIPFSQLPDLSPEELLDLLMSECAPLSMWMDFAKAYLAQNKVEQFKYMLTEGTSNEVAQEVEKFFGYKPLYEQIQFYCGLAALHIQLGQDERDKTRRQQHFGDAQKAIVKAQDLDNDEQLIFLARGLLSAAKGDMDRAGKEFHVATLKKNDKRPNIVATLALAALAFNQRRYNEALTLYKKALTQNPACPPEVRLGLAACYFKLGNLQMAQKAYERVLQLDPESTEAHLGLAVLKFNASNIQQGLADGLKQLVRAYELDPQNTAVLNTLAHFCILRGNFHKAVALANAAYKTSESDALKASCVGQLARAYHGVGDFENAKKYYQLAVRMDQKLPLPRLGMAQMYIREGEYKNAATELESMLAYAPGCYDGLMILGRLYPQMPTKVEKTISHFKDAAGKRPNDPEARELLAELLSASDPAAALEAITATLDIHRRLQREAEAKRAEYMKKKAEANGNHDLFGDGDDEDNSEAPPEYHLPAKLLNNAAVLFYRADKPEQALKLMEESLKEMELADGNSNVAPMQKVTLIYNMARIHEMNGNLTLAKEGYQSILKDFPTYTECYLRMACVAKTIGDTKAAIHWAQKAVAVEGGSADANALLATLYLGNREYHQAEEVLKKLRSEPGNKHDTYAHLAQANLYYTSQSHDHYKDDPKKKADRLQQALDFYVRVLSHEPRNIYAANGIGAVLAEQGHVNEAQEVFMAVQEASTASDGFVKLADVWVNLANVYLAKEDYVSAIKMYKNTSAKFYHHKNAQVLLYLSRAHYDSGDLSSAKTCLLQALHVAPGDKVLWFDVALTMQERAVRVFQNKQPMSESSKLDAYSRAVLELEKALRLFQQLEEFVKNKQGEKLDPKKLSRHVEFCEQSLKKAQQYVKQAEQQAEVREKKRQATAELMSREKQQKALQVENAKYVERKKKEEREEAAKRQEERMATLREQWRMQRNHVGDDGEGQERPKKKKKSEKKKKGKAEEDFFVDPNEEGEYPDENGDAEYEEGAESDDQAHLREAGLASGSDSEGAAVRDEEEEEDGERVADRKSSKEKKKKRLRREAEAGEQEGAESDGAAAALEDEFADEGLNDDDDDGKEKSSKKRARRQTAFDDDDEEEGQAPAEEKEQGELDDQGDAPEEAEDVAEDADELPLEAEEVDELFDE